MPSSRISFMIDTKIKEAVRTYAIKKGFGHTSVIARRAFIQFIDKYKIPIGDNAGTESDSFESDTVMPKRI